MELINLKSIEDQKSAIHDVLKTLVSKENMEDITSGMLLSVEDGGYLYSIKVNGDTGGFFLLTPLSEDEDSKKVKIDLISVEEIWVKTEYETRALGDYLSQGFKRISKEFKCQEIDVIITQAGYWLTDIFQENGFICSEIKLEKVLPLPSNLGDVLELIQDCMPIDRIVQVLFEKDGELRAEFLENVEEATDLITDNWLPTLVIVTFEPDSLDIKEMIKSSNTIIHWDDYILVYRGA